MGGVGGGGVGEPAHGVFEEGFFGGAARHEGEWSWGCWNGGGAEVREMGRRTSCDVGADWGEA